MAIQTFTSGQVLTAAQVNALQANDYNQTVSTKTASYTLVAADKGTRIVMNSASATTITVNTSLFAAGDTLTLLNIGAGVCTITAGTATVSTTGTLALVQNAGGTLYFTSAGVSVFQAAGVAASAGGLVFIQRTTVTAAATVDIAGCFTSTYNDYRLIITLRGSSDNNKLKMTLAASGTPVTSGYAAGVFIGDYSSGAPPLLNAGYASGARFELGYIPNNTGNPDNNANIQLDVFGPQATQKTAINGLTTSVQSGSANSGGMIIGFLDSTTSYDGFQISNVSATNMTGTIAIYGYAKA
jgi:hypothetical protein